MLQSASLAHIQQDSLPAIERERSKVRGMFVKAMKKGVFRSIPLSVIPLTFLLPYPSAVLFLRFGCDAELGLLRCTLSESLIFAKISSAERKEGGNKKRCRPADHADERR
jgi:hypothetical protein